MASHPNVPVRDQHLIEASAYAFDHADEVMRDLKVALTNHSTKASSPAQRAFLDRLLNRLSFSHEYWNQLQQDFEAGLSSPRTKVKTFIETVRDNSFRSGYEQASNTVREEAYHEGLAEGYGEGWNDASPQPAKYIAIGAGVCFCTMYVIHAFMPWIFDIKIGFS